MSKYEIKNCSFNAPSTIGEYNTINFDALSNELQNFKEQMTEQSETVRKELYALEVAIRNQNNARITSLLKHLYQTFENFCVGFSSSYMASLIK